ncbi:MAG: hypothetical protein AAGI53_05045 [Planctomycetota bacterium]
MPSEPPGNAGASPARCVLLHQPNAWAPEPLLSALVRRNIEVSACTSAHRAMAMLCALAGRDDDSPLILLLVNAEGVGLSAALVDAVEIYVPVAAVWVYEEDGEPQLRAVERSDLERWSRRRPPTPSPSLEAKPEAWSEPSLKLVDDPEQDDLDRPGAGPSTTPPSEPLAQSDPPGSRRPVDDPVTGFGEAGAPPPDRADSAGRTEDHGDDMEGPVSLTDDELSMLLADEWTDPGRP